MHESITRCNAVLRLSLASTVLLLPALGAAQSSATTGEVPEGLSGTDWSSIRAAYEAGRHAAVPVEAGYRVRNPGQRWQTVFDGRGFTTQPDQGRWTWGLQLESYGFAGAQRALDRPNCIDAEGPRVSYEWDETLEEWYVNDQRGMEHGFTVHERPTLGGLDQEPGPLTFTLVVRGNLMPEVMSSGRGVRFLDGGGAAVLSYSGLRAFDADGKDILAYFEALSGGVLLSVHESGARYPLTIDPIAAEQAYLKASNTDDAFPNNGDRFGVSVSVSGDTIVVGADREDSNATGVNGDQTDNTALESGAAYVFVRSGIGWIQQAYLKASNNGKSDLFGSSVSVSGDTVTVGAFAEDSNATGVNGDQSDNSSVNAGAAYVFVRSGTTWSQQAYLKASNTDAVDQFGIQLSVSGDTLIVAAPTEESNAIGVNGNQSDNSLPGAGAAYVFVRSGTIWSQQAYLKASNTGPSGQITSDQFGSSVSVSGDTVVVGAYFEDSSATGVDGDQGDTSVDAGAAYVFVRSGTTWSQQAYLKASNTDLGDQFGESVSVSGDTVVVGAPREASDATGVNGDQGNGAHSAGAAYVFVREGTSWSQQAYLKASNTDGGDRFGQSLSLSGDTVVVGAVAESSNATGVNGDESDNSAFSAGAVYVFKRHGVSWFQLAYLKASNTDPTDFFGASTSVSGERVAVGAYREKSAAKGVNGDQGDNSTLNAGAAYVFDLGFPLANYCTQTKPTGVPDCFPVLTAFDLTLATGSWDTVNIPRNSALPDANVLGIYIFTNAVGTSQSTIEVTTPYGTLCLQGFRRSAPLCPPVSTFAQSGVCNPGVLSLPLNCNSGALALSVGDDVNVQLWYRNPSAAFPGNANFSNAIFYTVQ